ncbi:hypothetical protein BCR42DRAFT_410922 [Absidia repens]|uniref:LRR-containing protein second PH domain-containing protein n=1 Tax=Absidia repens TaxID=90262 RepID=A0A1X2IL15_9FUNG|nr:hypothetical protein BCR42DRAFT_410922 [Absidia repens]
MFMKENYLQKLMTTPPSSPPLIYSSGESVMNDVGNQLDQTHSQNSGGYANSPPVSPMKSLSQSAHDQILPADQDATLPPILSFDTLQQHTILYSGEMILCSHSRFSRQKRCYCILTPTSLVRFKSFDKAKKAYPVLKGGNAKLSVNQSLLHNQKTLVALEHVFAVYKIQLPSLQQGIRINFVDSADLSKQPGSLTLVPITNENSSPLQSLVSMWIHALRSALESYLPGLITVGSAEQFAAIERTKKQNDQSTTNHPIMIHKVILKTKKTHSKTMPPPSPLSSGNVAVNHMVPSSSSASTATSSTSTTMTTSAEQKDVYIPVIFLLGRNSLYLIPSKSDHDDYRRYVSRDRYGLMAITGIMIHDGDDTITIDLCTLQGPSYQLKLITSVGRLLVCAIQKAVQQLVPHFPYLPYTLVCPSVAVQQKNRGSSSSTSELSSSLSLSAAMTDTIHSNTIEDKTTTALSPIAHWRRYLSQPWQQQKLNSLQNQTSTPTSLYNTVTTQYDAVLMAYCAALNLDKRRFRYTVEKSQRKSRLYTFTVLPSNEINGNFTLYSKYELLAIFRTLRHIDFFETVSFKDIQLTPLATWFISKDDSWTQQDSNSMCFPTMLANEVFLLLSYNNHIQSLDLSGYYKTSYTYELPPGDTLSSSLTLARLPTTLSLVRSNTLVDGIPVMDQMTPTSSASASKCQQCLVQAIFLSMQTSKSLNLSSIALDGHILHEQDIDLLIQLLLAPANTLDLSPVAGLRCLSFRRAQLSTVCLEDLLLAITQGPTKDWVECLDLQENDGQISVDVFTQVWQQCKRLSQFGAACHFRSDESLDLVRYPKVMNKLDLSGSTLEDKHILELCTWLTHHATTLRPPTKTQFDLCLVLTQCGLHGQHVHQLVHAVSGHHHRRLRFSLELGDNPLTKQVVYQPWLWSSLSKYGPTSLKLQKVVWESASLRELFESLIQNKIVEKLDLSYAILDRCNEQDNFISLSPPSPTVEDCTMTTSYSNAIGTNTTKRSSTSSTILMSDSTLSNVSPNDHAATISNSNSTSTSTPTPIPFTFDPTTVLALANLFQKMTHLTSFTMDAEQQEEMQTSITTKSKSTPKRKRMTEVGNLLSSTFRHLALSRTSFNTSLTTISMKNQGLGDNTIQALCQWGKLCPSLQSLYVDGNSLTISGFRSLWDLVKTNSSVYDLPRPELDFRWELQRLESEAWKLQESEAELQYLVIHMVGVDSRRAHSLIDDQTAAREAIMVDRSQLPLVADQLEQQVQLNAAHHERQSRHMAVKPYWPTTTTTSARPASTFSASSASISNSNTTTLVPPQPSLSASCTRKSSAHHQPAPSTSMTRRYRQRRPSSSTSSIYSFYQEYPTEMLADALPPPTCPLPAIPSPSSLSSTPY